MLNDVIHDLAPVLVLGAFLVVACGTYLVWPSRWNIPAHAALGFAVVAYVVPILLLGQLDDYPRALVVQFAKIMVLGAFCYCVGMLFGASLAGRDRVLRRFGTVTRLGGSDLVARRAFVVFLVAVVALAAAIGLMGFIPMFAENPLEAKFFRGRYAAAYQPVAPLFRGATAIITALIPVAAAYAWTRVGAAWKVALASSVGLMALTLQRGPAFSGLLVFLGVLLVTRRRTVTFLVIVVLSYIAGTLMYVVLGQLGVESFAGTELTGGSLLQTIAATAPDIPDVMGFLERWQPTGHYTLGRTFFGGLIPGNFPWNPGVWTITLGDPGYDIASTVSGGLRLPMPVWGYVSFGLPGVAAVAGVSGMFAGHIARVMHHLVEAATDPVTRTWALVLGASIGGLTTTFYVVGYIDVIQFIVLLGIVLAARRPPARRAPATRASAPISARRTPARPS